MSVFTEFERDPDALVGVMWEQFTTALGIWVYTNADVGRELTVTEAATVFNTTPELVREAVEDNPWLFHPDDAKLLIESDGE